MNFTKWKEEESRFVKKVKRKASKSGKIPSDLASFIRFQHQRAEYYASKI